MCSLLVIGLVKTTFTHLHKNNDVVLYYNDTVKRNICLISYIHVVDDSYKKGSQIGTSYRYMVSMFLQFVSDSLSYQVPS